MKFRKLVFTVWVFLWILFLARGLYKGEFNKYKALLMNNPEARRAQVIGEDLYDFITTSLDILPEHITYAIEGDLRPLKRYTLIYYLYPRKESRYPEYIIKTSGKKISLENAR